MGIAVVILLLIFVKWPYVTATWITFLGHQELKGHEQTAPDRFRYIVVTRDDE